MLRKTKTKMYDVDQLMTKYGIKKKEKSAKKRDE